MDINDSTTEAIPYISYEFSTNALINKSISVHFIIYLFLPEETSCLSVVSVLSLTAPPMSFIGPLPTPSLLPGASFGVGVSTSPFCWKCTGVGGRALVAAGGIPRSITRVLWSLARRRISTACLWVTWVSEAPFTSSKRSPGTEQNTDKFLSACISLEISHNRIVDNYVHVYCWDSTMETIIEPKDIFTLQVHMNNNDCSQCTDIKWYCKKIWQSWYMYLLSLRVLFTIKYNDLQLRDSYI